ncbi:MAG: LCP family protein [Ruminococcus sp.]|nr:LCP family protein [Ruminococcus sp.]
MSSFDENNQTTKLSKDSNNHFINYDSENDQELISSSDNNANNQFIALNYDDSEVELITLKNNKKNKSDLPKNETVEKTTSKISPSEEITEDKNEVEETTANEGISLQGERTPVAVDEKTRHDDADDFVLAQKNKHRKRVKKKHHSHSVIDDGTPVLMSTRSRGSHHHHHHHSHSGSSHRSSDENFILMSNRGRGEQKKSSNSTTDSTHRADEDTPVLMSDRSRSRHHHHSHHHSSSHSHGHHHSHHHSSSHSHGHHHSHHSTSMKKWQKILIGIGCGILSLVLIATGIVAYLLFDGSNQIKPSDYSISAPDNINAEFQESGQTIVYKGNTYTLNKNIAGILFMGIDKENIEGSYKINGTNGQADVIILMAVDTSTGKSTLINVSRDTMTDVATYSATGTFVETAVQQICLSYAYGNSNEASAENTVSSVERLFYNFPISSYYALDLNGISAINDALGGINVVSPETIGEFENGQSYLLTGKQSERFVRLRDTTNLESNSLRMQRQQTYLNSFINKLITETKNNFSTPLDLFDASKHYSSSNLNPSKISYLAANVLLSDGFAIDTASIPGKIEMGEKYAEYYVDEEKFFEMFLSIFYNKVQ